MDRTERRKYNRLPLQLDLTCLEVGATADKFHTGRTVNVSPGGLFFETEANSLHEGNLLKVELSIPPTEGLLEFGGRIAGFARVLRSAGISEEPLTNLYGAKTGIALEFCEPLKLST